MSNSGVNVLRYSALLFGCGYGFYHQRTITSKAKQDHLDHEYRRQEGLIQQAKAEWSKKTTPKDTTPGVISDPADPKFDLEAFLMSQFGETAK